jgi:hypothetical protein
VERPREELKGFQRVTVAAQRNQDRADSALKASTLAWWDEKLPGFRVEPSPSA